MRTARWLSGLLAAGLVLHGCGGGNSNSPPQAVNLNVLDVNGGEAEPGDLLRADYDYVDADDDPEDNSEIRWLRNGTAIAGAAGGTYTLTENDSVRRIGFEVTPVAAGGQRTGEAAMSPAIVTAVAAGQRLPVTQLTSAMVGVTYSVSVYLPPGYSDTSRVYPLVYALDAENWFEISAGALDENGLKAILVAVGNTDTDGNNRRGIDYLWPGANDYLSFLTQELAPVIEASYRVDADQRILSGHSFGGLFANWAWLTEAGNDSYFTAILSQDASIWRQQTEILQRTAEVLPALNDGELRLMIAYATEPGTNGYSNQLLLNALENRDADNVTVVPLSYAENHDGMFAPSFVAGMSLLLNQETP